MSFKQNPASIRSYEDILHSQIKEGEKQLDRKGKGLFFSSLSAGLDIGFGPFLMAAVLTFASGVYSEASIDFLLAALYPVGFIFVVISRTDLYTELDARAVFPVLNNLSSLSRLIRLWAYVIIGNLIGGFLFSAMAVYIGIQYGIVEPQAFAHLANVYTERTTWQLFMGAIFAGWLMGLVAWLVVAARTTISAIFFVWLCTFTIALLHLPHSIAGNVEVAMGLFVDPAVSIFDYGRFLIASLIGNAIGAIIFAAILKFAGRPQTS